MVFKIRTSKSTMNYFEEIAASENLQPFILSKLAIALSLKDGRKLTNDDFRTDNNGLELNRQTITGDYDLPFKCLIEVVEEKHLDEDEYFQVYLKGHLDRGAKMLYSEFKYNRDLLIALLSKKTGL